MVPAAVAALEGSHGWSPWFPREQSV